ncbi:MAG: hypothetical protein KIS61_22750 [Candidatus Eremiobacteraeota bacterium]|nr:hypothetical protein [Candidatus Eremiobacteraeota bacterium]
MLWLTLLLLGQLFAVDQPAYLGLDGGVYGPNLKRIGLGSGTSLAIHGQTAYLVGSDGRVWSAGGSDWRPLEGAPALAQAQKVVVEPSGALVILGTDSGIYRLRRNWYRIGLASARDLDVSPAGDLFIVGSDAHVWTSAAGQTEWRLYNALAAGKKLAAAQGMVYLIGTDNGVYRITPEQIERQGLATAQEISVSSSGQVAIVGMDNGVYYLQSGDWKRQGGGTARLVIWPR